MSLIIRSTRVACATSDGTQDITISGFGTPKAAMFILTRATADATATDEAAISIGFTDGTRNRGVRWISQHGADTSDVYAGESASYCVEMYDNAGSEEAAAAFSAWITDGVRINWTNAPPSAYLLTVVLLGGTDLANAYTNHFAIDTTQNNTVDITDPGFKPTDVLTLKVLTTYRNIIVGAVHNTSGDVVTQSSGGISERDNRGTSELVGACQSAYGSFELFASALLGRFEFGSFDANGFSCTTRETTATASNILYLALQITTYDSYTGSFTTPTSTGNQGQTGPGFKPQFLMQLGTNMDAVNTAYTDNRGGAFGVFVADATAQYSNQIATEDAADTTNTESQSDDQMAVLHDDDGSALFATTFVSFDTNGWTQNFTATNTGAAKYWLVWAVEEEAGSGITEEIGLATETDTPQAITRAKSKALGLSTESDTPLAMVTAKTRAIGLVTETDTAQSMPTGIGTQYVDGYGGDVDTAADVNLHQTAHTYNGGTHPAIQFGTYNYGLLKFNLSAIPAGSTITDAKLYLGLYEGNGTANIYAVLAANDGWIEGTRNLQLALEDEPCWDAKQADGSGGIKTAWAGGANGCGVVGTDISADTIGVLNAADGAGVYAVDLDTDTVQGWIGESNTNYGILIKPTVSNSNHIALAEYGTAEYRPKLVVYYKVAHTIAVNQVIESDTSQAIARLKSKAVGQNEEANTSQPISRLKSKVVEQIGETDSAQSLSGLKAKLIGQASETDTAFAITILGAQVIAIGQVTETDLAQAIAKLKDKAIGQVAESDLSQAISGLKAKAIGLPEEVDIVFSVGGIKARAIGQVIEINEALAILVLGESIIAIGQVDETNLAQAIASLKTKAIAQASESDLAQAVTRVKSHELGIASETDLAQAFSKLKAKLIGQASETDLAQAILFNIILSLYLFDLHIRRVESFDAEIRQEQAFDMAIRQEES